MAFIKQEANEKAEEIDAKVGISKENCFIMFPSYMMCLLGWSCTCMRVNRGFSSSDKVPFSNKNYWYFSYFSTKHMLQVLIRSALLRHS